MTKEPYRVMLITNAYAPYRVPVWDALARVVQQLKVILLSKQESNRIWDIQQESTYLYHILGAKSVYIPKIDNYFYFGGKIINEIKSYEPTHIIIAGYQHLPFIEAILYAKVKKIPLIQWFESHSNSSYFKTEIIHWLRSFFLRQSNAWIAAGQLTQHYLQDMGIPKERIVIAPNVVDISTYKRSKIPPRKGKTRFLYAGRYISYKGIDLLLDGFAHLPEDEVVLRLVGHGPMENNIKEQTKKTANIEILSAAKSPKEMAKHYAWADILVFPTFRDTWGLVVNEALASGCYVLASQLAGVTPDLIGAAPLDVGVIFNPEDGVNSLITAMQNVISRTDQIRLQRENIRNWGNQFTPELWGDRALDALKIASGDKK